MNSSQINADELIRRIKQGEKLNMLDVRGTMEFHTFNIGGENIPLPDLADRLDLLPWDKADEIIVICKIGLRSKTAQSILTQNGYQHVRNLSGGLIAVRKL